MRRLLLGLPALAVIAIALISTAPAFADPPAVMLLSETGVFGTLRRAPVEFTHQYHASGMSCLTCHHDFRDGKNVLETARLVPGDPAARCATCHSTPAALQQAFHGECITCHDKLKKPAGRPGAPRLCGDCHTWERER